MDKVRWMIGCLALVLVSCGAPNPQIPSQRKGQVPQADSATLALMALNAQLAQTADRAVIEAAQSQEETYAQYEGNCWMHIVDAGDTDQGQVQPGQPYIVHMRVYTLDEYLLTDVEGTYVVGKSELPAGVELNITELHHGAKARLFVPWYMAFGLQGTEHIPPYENVIIDLEIR